MRLKEDLWYRRWWRLIRQEMRWFTPGIGVKRWIGLILIGTTLIGVGIAMALLEVYRTAPDTWWLPALSLASLRFLERPLRVLIFGLLGVGMLAGGIYGLNRSLLSPFLRPGEAVVDTVTAYRRRERGPRIVVMGGGTGLSALLRGLKAHTNNLTAIVTVADDGGSSGELRRTRGILPPGDIRNCLTALSDDEALLSQIFQYRFASGEGLNGHSLGNLFITAMADITGSFEEAVAEAGHVLAVKGRVLPATLHDVRLAAMIKLPDQDNEVQIKGESEITKQGGIIRRLWLEPNNPLAFPPTLQAILSADMIVIGPGSLYTSLLPNLLVPDLAEAVRASRAIKFYVCNVATQPGETDGYSCGDHVRTLEKQTGGHIFDLVIINQNMVGKLPANIDWVRPEPDLNQKYPVYQTDLVDNENPWRHDSKKLGQTVMDLYYERTGPLIPHENS
jgi:uncharacterized cofD-like protein